MEFLLFILALAIGGIATWQVFAWRYGKRLRKSHIETLDIESNILLEKIEKVFKIIVAEGHFTEIYDHNSKKDFWGFFKANKKALVVTKAKVAIGFDFAKLKMERDEETKKLKVVSFPDAEVLSIDTDYKFYDIDQGWLHKFKTDDYTKILTDAKALMKEKAMNSELPGVANKQVLLMMQQLAETMQWEIDYDGNHELKKAPLIEKKASPSPEA